MGAQEIHPEDEEECVCLEEGPLEGVSTEAQPPLFLPPGPDREAVWAGEPGLLSQWVLGPAGFQAER